jgi:hypothetical protein
MVITNYACAMCTQSGSDIDLKRCSKCLTTCYCSRECQIRHWKTHKAECIKYAAPSTVSQKLPIDGLNQDQMIQRPFEITKIMGKGHGVLATCKILKGTRILSEKPIFVVPRTVNDLDIVERVIIKSLARLDEGQRKAFFALTNIHGTKHSAALGIARTNILPLGAAAVEGGLFLQASRFNHACSHNAQNTWNTDTNQLTIHAFKDIEAGEEICISYLDGSENYRTRQRNLKDRFAFECSCNLCLLPPTQRRESDARLDEITRLDTIIGDGVGIVTTPMAYLHHVYTIVRLLEEEHIADARVPRAYYDALQITIAHGDQARAKVFAERAYAARVVVEGEDSPETRRLKSFMENPSIHRLYGTTKKWRQDSKKIPRDMCATDFEGWLWKKKLLS